MADIYVATKGEYSDYHIVGVFESAVEAAKHGEVEIFPLNRAPDAVVQKCWVVAVKNTIYWQIHKRKAVDVEDFWISKPREMEYVAPLGERGFLVSGCTYEPHLRYETAVASFVSPEHAHKLAVELIQDCLQQFHLDYSDDKRVPWAPDKKEETDL